MVTPKTITIETERMMLKEHTPELYKYLFEECRADDIKQVLGCIDDAAYNKECERYNAGMTSYQLSFKNFLMTDKATGTPIGKIGFHTWKAAHSRAEIGYGIFEEKNKNKGYMKEALQPVLEYGFEYMNLNRIEAFASPENTASIKLIENHGFIYEGLLRQHYGNNGVAEDSAVYGLLKPEFTNKGQLRVITDMS